MSAQQARNTIYNLRNEARRDYRGYAVSMVNWVSLECVVVNDFQVEFWLTDLDNPADYVVCESFDSAVWLLTTAITAYVQ